MRPGYVAWSDEDWGYIQDTMDRPAAEVAAEMGRSRDSVYTARSQMRAGYVPTIIRWTEEEDQYLRDTPTLTAEEVARTLNRSYPSVVSRRKYLTMNEGLSWGGPNKSPNKVGSRRLIAQTCRRCGLLLDAYWFLTNKGGANDGIWRRDCRRCDGGNNRRTREQARNYANARNTVLQRLSLKHADRKGEEWTEADQRVLANPDLSAFEKSVLTKRTFFATKQAVNRFGHTSRPEIGDPKDSQWVIQLHPNVQRLLAAESGAMAA